MTGRRLLENDATLVQLCPAFFQPLSLTLSQTLTVSFYYVNLVVTARLPGTALLRATDKKCKSFYRAIMIMMA